VARGKGLIPDYSDVISPLTPLNFPRHRMFKTAFQQGRMRITTGGVPPGYVEDFDEPRTKLEAVFNILLILPDLRFRIPRVLWNLRLRVPLVEHQQIPH